MSSAAGSRPRRPDPPRPAPSPRPASPTRTFPAPPSWRGSRSARTASAARSRSVHRRARRLPAKAGMAKMSPSMDRSPARWASARAASFPARSMARSADGRSIPMVNAGSPAPAGVQTVPSQRRTAKSRGSMSSKRARSSSRVAARARDGAGATVVLMAGSVDGGGGGGGPAGDASRKGAPVARGSRRRRIPSRMGRGLAGIKENTGRGPPTRPASSVAARASPGPGRGGAPGGSGPTGRGPTSEAVARPRWARGSVHGRPHYRR